MIESQIAARVLPSKCREAVKVRLQEVYWYEDFRNLEVYDDLFKGKEKLQLSQGQLIEEVIMEAEKGHIGITFPFYDPPHTPVQTLFQIL